MTQDRSQNSGEKQKVTDIQQQVIIDYYAYKIGDEPLPGNPIKKIFGVDPKFIVYLSDDSHTGEKDKLCLHYADPLPDHLKSYI